MKTGRKPSSMKGNQQTKILFTFTHHIIPYLMYSVLEITPDKQCAYLCGWDTEIHTCAKIMIQLVNRGMLSLHYNMQRRFFYTFYQISALHGLSYSNKQTK